MSTELLQLVMTIAPSATQTITKLLAYRKKPSNNDVTILLLASVIEQVNTNNKCMTEMTTALRVLRSDMVKKGLI